MAAKNSPAIVATVSADALGDIVKLPGMGKRQVNLAEFNRTGLHHLANKSFIRCERRSYEIHNEMMGISGYELPSTRCASCERTFGDICGYTITTKECRTYEIVKFVPADNQTRDGKPSYRGNDAFMVCVCFDCATERQTIIDAINGSKFAPKFAPTIAEDEQDVYAFVAQSIREDRLHGTANYPNVELRLLGGGYYGGGDDATKRYHTVIGGRIAAWLAAQSGAIASRGLNQEMRNERIAARRIKAAEKAASATQSDDTTDDTPNADTTLTGDSSASDDAPIVEPKPKRTRRASKHER